ncbi:hypothetical protein GCM10011529_17400 [Polymorphobacter glacialis]|uniref:Uncharacterized protein n=1 Tax=Sandarakinorhabdus glacialis TaxID=1614636 RepID=A0A916ZT92_9SPHN|nr:hypothetical protein [Polymorphobacter glacialis]GGE11583.1 hypothetical protein GCM10011529_17400 [Polymorphobacter glacialis]
MNPFEMVVLIILIVTIGRVLGGRFGKRGGRAQALFDTGGDGVSVAEAARLKAEVTRLNERIQVLERLATDPAKRLSDEIESLKNK